MALPLVTKKLLHDLLNTVAKKPGRLCAQPHGTEEVQDRGGTLAAPLPRLLRGPGGVPKHSAAVR